MAVFCEFISLIIRRDSIDKYFPGGWTRFVLELPNYSMATDGELVRVGFMNPMDTETYLDFLKGEGLQFRESGAREINDIEDLDQFNGHLEKRSWLEFGDRDFNGQEFFCCWKKDSSIDALAFSSHGNRGGPLYPIPKHVEPENFNKRYKFIRVENGLDIYSLTRYKEEMEFYLPEGMTINDYYENFSKWREGVSHRVNNRIKNRVDKKKEVNHLQADKTVSPKPIIERKRLSEEERKQLKDYQLREFTLRHQNGKLSLEQIWKGDLIVQNEYHYNGKLRSVKTLDKDGNEVSSEYFHLNNYRWFTKDVEPEDFSGEIGEILKEYIENPLNTMKKEKRKILDRLYDESKKQGYIFFWGYSHNFGISRVGDSYIYDVPAKKTGNLREFRNQRIRVICLGSGKNFDRSYIAGRI